MSTSVSQLSVALPAVNVAEPLASNDNVTSVTVNVGFSLSVTVTVI